MVKYTVTCAVCGRVFSSKNKTSKYCSPICRVEGAKRTRKEWEQTSCYKEKQKERMQERRQEERQAVEEKKKNRRIQTLSLITKETSERQTKSNEERHKKARQGDLNALQILALDRDDTLEYWRLYKEQLLLSEKEFGRRGRHTVGGIDIHEEKFEQLVVSQIRQGE